MMINRLKGICRSNRLGFHILSNITTNNAIRLNPSLVTKFRPFSVSSIKYQDEVSKNLQQVIQKNYEEETQIDSENDILKELNQYLDKNGFIAKNKSNDSKTELIKNINNETIVHIYFNASEIVESESFLKTEEEETEEYEGFTISNDSNSNPLDNYESDGQNHFIQFGIVIENLITKKSLSAGCLMSSPSSTPLFLLSELSINDTELTLSETPEDSYIKELNYNGPTFNSLDQQLQSDFELYFNELGINRELVQFIFDYSYCIENKDYIKWLDQMNSFFKN